MKKYLYDWMLCLLGPYGDFFIEVLAEIITKFPDVDAFSFEGLHYGGVCYCGHCRVNYRKGCGAEIPNAEMNDPAFRRYQHWADRRLENLVKQMQSRLKGKKPDVAPVTWTTNAGRFGHFLSIPRNMPARMNLLLDAPDQEFWLDETNRGTTIVPAFGIAHTWATTNHRTAFSEPYILSHGNPYGKDSFDFKQDVGSFLNSGRMPTYVGSNSVTFKGPALRVRPTSPTAKVVGTLRVKSGEGSPEVPGVIAGTYGKGPVVYLAGGFDSAYYLYAYPYERLLLRNAIDWAAASPQPVKIEAPMCVHSTVMRQTKDGADRLIVHLYSDLNTTAFHALPNDDVPLREEVVPILDSRITFGPGYRLARAHLEPEGQDLKVEVTPSGSTVVVPRLDIHVMVVGELK
jgi:hypothetical protein